MTTGFLTRAALVLLCTATPSVAGAASLSFTGVFLQDDQVELIPFTVGTPGGVVLRTFGYGGGVNAAGDLIAASGFDPMLTLFDGAGWQLVQNDDAGCGSVGDPGTGICLDARIDASLPAGSYVLALTQWGNFSFGPTLDDGFLQAGTGNYTGPDGFWDAKGAPRTGLRAVDITTPDAQPVPEPATVLLVGGGLAALCRTRSRAASRRRI